MSKDTKEETVGKERVVLPPPPPPHPPNSRLSHEIRGKLTKLG